MSPDPQPDSVDSAPIGEAGGTLDSMRLRISKLERDRAVLRNRLVIADWKNQVLRSRRWWRIGSVLGAFVKRPWRFLPFARDLRAALSDGGSPPPRPALEEVSLVHSPTPEAPPITDIVSEPGSEARSDPFDSTLRPLLLTVPEAMTLAPPPAATAAEVRVAAILDEPSRHAFAPECRLLTFAPHDWLEVFETNAPQLLLVEAAWRGNRGSWEYKVGTYDHPESVGLVDLTAVVEWCRSRGIPTVFWNNEDPVHFERFREAAERFDVVYTRDAAMVERYQALPGVEGRSVGVLSFGVQPLVNDPVGSLQRRDARPLFVGGFRGSVDKRIRSEMLLDAAAPYNPVIYVQDGLPIEEIVPERFRGYIVGSVATLGSAGIFRRHRAYLDAEDGNGSTLSREAYAAIAGGTPVVAISGTGSGRLDELVSVVGDEGAASETIERLVAGGAEWTEVSTRGIEEVFARHTYADRLHQILDDVGIDVNPVRTAITAVVAADSEITPEEIAESSMVSEVIVPNASESREVHGPAAVPIRSVATDEATDGEAVCRALARAASEPWVAVVRRGSDLAALQSLAVATRITPAEVYTAAESSATEHRFVREPGGAAPVIISAAFLSRFGMVPGHADWSAARVYAVPIIDD